MWPTLREIIIGIVSGIVSGLLVLVFGVFYVDRKIEERKRQQWKNVRSHIESGVFAYVYLMFLRMSILLKIEGRIGEEHLPDMRAMLKEYVSFFKDRLMPEFTTKFKPTITEWDEQDVGKLVRSARDNKSELERRRDMLLSFSNYVEPGFLEGTIQAINACVSVEFLMQGLLYTFGENPDVDVAKIKNFIKDLTEATEKLLEESRVTDNIKSDSWLSKGIKSVKRNNTVILAIIGTLVASFGGQFLYHHYTEIKSDKIIGYLPYAYHYKYPDGTTYKGATTEEGNWSRNITDDTPIPIEKGKETPLWLGIENHNNKTLQNVTLNIVTPKEIKVTKWERWAKYGDRQYFTFMSNIHSECGSNAEAIYIKAEKEGRFNIRWHVGGLDMEGIDRMIPLSVYEK